MKTSFYFVLWILIYPILGLFHNSVIDNNAFVAALALVWGMSWLLNRLMPDTLTYEHASQIAPILEDVYMGNVESFRKRLSRESIIETITTVYFTITTVVIALAIFKAGIDDWIALAVFGFFTVGSISQSVNLLKAKSRLQNTPTPEQCMEIAEDTYKLDYASYYDIHNGVSYQDMLPPRPKYFKAFQVFSTVIAIIASLLGLLYIILSVLIMISQTSLEAGAVAGMYFLYGSLATYFGVKDFVSLLQSLKKSTQLKS